MVLTTVGYGEKIPESGAGQVSRSWNRSRSRSWNRSRSRSRSKIKGSSRNIIKIKSRRVDEWASAQFISGQ